MVSKASATPTITWTFSMAERVAPKAIAPEKPKVSAQALAATITDNQAEIAMLSHSGIYFLRKA